LKRQIIGCYAQTEVIFFFFFFFCLQKSKWFKNQAWTRIKRSGTWNNRHLHPRNQRIRAAFTNTYLVQMVDWWTW
jgi:hypothetical protein